MEKYIILFVVIIIVIILFMNSDLLKINDINIGKVNDSDKNLLKIKKMLKKNHSDYLSSDDSSSIYKNKKLMDDSSDPFAYDNSDISFDDSSSISVSKNIKNKKLSDNKKLLDDFRKFIEIKNKNMKKNKNMNMNMKKNENMNMKINNNQKINNNFNIQEMHKLAAQLSKNEPRKKQQQISEIAHSDVNINNDLTDTINGIIHNELNNKN
jgi:hypothetical protein